LDLTRLTPDEFELLFLPFEHRILQGVDIG
jgi:hypothetical protein